jgi:hypothetical protein
LTAIESLKNKKTGVKLTSNKSYLAIFLDKLNGRIDQPIKQITQVLAVSVGSQHFWQAVDPGPHQRSPSKRDRLQVNHAASADSSWLQFNLKVNAKNALDVRINYQITNSVAALHKQK